MFEKIFDCIDKFIDFIGIDVFLDVFLTAFIVTFIVFYSYIIYKVNK